MGCTTAAANLVIPLIPLTFSLHPISLRAVARFLRLGMQEVAFSITRNAVGFDTWVPSALAVATSIGSSPTPDAADTDKLGGVRCQRTPIAARWL